MNQPNPAIVAQVAVKRLPRLALWLFCLAYILAGFIGRVPWKNADISSFGYMLELAVGKSDWWQPTLGGLVPEVPALLPYWLGAWAVKLSPDGLSADLAARVPFMLLLAIALIATWYGTYYLARSPLAQPVAFAFGGEAKPTDYARALADAGLLAMMACLGLAQLAHETTPALAQLCFTALLFYAAAALPYRPLIPGLAAAGGLLGLTLSGAPAVALLFGLGSALIYLRESPLGDVTQKHRQLRATGMAGMTLLCALLAIELNLWRWSLELPLWSQGDWPRLGRLFLWFTWPAWPLACWTVWRWRLQLRSARLNSRHLWIPLWFLGVAGATTLVTSAADRALLLALPALATLAAFALPTLSRSMGALIDWFTLIFFSGCAIVIWVVWLSMQTGIPAKPALNVARLAPAFVHSFSPITFSIALIATSAWAWLVFWRTGRHRAALWKSVVLPAGGAALCWLLLMTLWLPLLDFARSYVPLVAQTTALMPQKPACISTLGLSRGQIAAYTYHGELSLKPVIDVAECNWLLGDSAVLNYLSQTTDNWEFRGAVRHRGDPKEKLLLYQRRD